jgi:hypothetical protein
MLTLIQGLQSACVFAFLGALIALLISSLRPGVRIFGSGTLFLCSGLWGLTLWLWCIRVLYLGWGVGLCVIGVLLGGVGVVPTALICLASAGRWPDTLDLLSQTALTFGGYLVAKWLAERAARQPARTKIRAFSKHDARHQRPREHLR